MAHIHIKLTVSEWDIGGKSDSSLYELDCPSVQVGQKLVVRPSEPNRYSFLVKDVSPTEVVLDCECPPAIIRLHKGEPYTSSHSFDGYEDHDGCVWNGEDEYLSIIWL